jgi:hypothetical protein
MDPRLRGAFGVDAMVSLIGPEMERLMGAGLARHRKGEDHSEGNKWDP